MQRTYSDCYESKDIKVRPPKVFGSFPNIFGCSFNPSVKDMDVTPSESIHYIKHIPVRLTRTRASCPSIRYSPTALQDRPITSTMKTFQRYLEPTSEGFYKSTSTIPEDEVISRPSSDIILTPFAQVLSNLHIVRDNIRQMSQHQLVLKSYDNIKMDKPEEGCENKSPIPVRSLASETSETLDWCLKTLEGVQTHRAVSDLTTRKLQKILNQELQQTTEESLADIQLCDYICDTFLENPLMDDEDCSEKDNSFEIDEKIENQIGSEIKFFKILDTSIDLWGIDLFDIHDLMDIVLTPTIFSIFKKRQFLQKFNISFEMLLNFSMAVEKGYRNLPYHNSIHAADVAQSSHVILNSTALKDVFTDLEMFAVIFASAIHDIDHPGVTNQYLINTNDPLATLYNDHSILENHHLATAFGLLKDTKLDILSNLNKQDKVKFRKMVIDMVLATDMAGHMSLLADLKTMVETKKVVGSGLLNLDNYHDRIKILQCLLHCSDLSNPTKPIEIYQKWVSRIMEEFHTQGDKERQLGIDISPMCDRIIAADDKAQIGFIDYIVKPLWDTWADLVYPSAQGVIDNLKYNHNFYTLKTMFSKVEKKDGKTDN